LEFAAGLSALCKGSVGLVAASSTGFVPGSGIEGESDIGVPSFALSAFPIEPVVSPALSRGGSDKATLTLPVSTVVASGVTMGAAPTAAVVI